MQYLYLIKCQQFYKIGVANDVQSRLAQLSTGNPFKLEVLAVYGFANAEFVERAIHQRFANERKRGEWFEIGDEAEMNFRHICQVLGGEVQDSHQRLSEDMIEEAEEMAEPVESGKWDYAAMFADGWRMERGNSKKGDWRWRRSVGGSKQFLYGGLIRDLPYAIEEMKLYFRAPLTEED